MMFHCTKNEPTARAKGPSTAATLGLPRFPNEVIYKNVTEKAPTLIFFAYEWSFFISLLVLKMSIITKHC